MLTVVTWKWGRLFGPEYVNTMRSMMLRHLHVPHQLVCVTEDPVGIDSDVTCVPPPYRLSTGHPPHHAGLTFPGTPRCIRRLKQYDGAWAREYLGPRFLSIDLDVVVTGDVTPLFDRLAPLVLWRVGYAQVYSGGIVLMDAGALDGMWQAFSLNPERYARAAQAAVYRERADAPWGDASDQPVLNHYVRTHPVPVDELRDEDGITTYFSGYRPADPPMAELRPGTRIVMFGSANKAVLDEGRHAWVREHWG
jgi:hypothetical protein